MSLPPPASREPTRTRRTVREGFARDRGLPDSPGRILDASPGPRFPIRRGAAK